MDEMFERDMEETGFRNAMKLIDWLFGKEEEE